MANRRFAPPALVAAACLVAVLTGASAQGAPRKAQSSRQPAPPAAPPLLPALPAGTEILRLENGLQVVLLRNPGQPMAGVYTQVLVGSAREDFRTSGMSHMLEHLLFNGTEKYTQEELYREADAIGAYNNANTTDFYTNYMMVVPAEHLEKGLELQAQMLFHSLIPADKFAKEQGIVLGEIAQGRDTPGEFAADTIREIVFGGSDLELPTVGTPATIEHMTRDDVHAFYRRWYVPNNMILTLAGNFDRDRALGWLAEHYGGVAPGTLERPLPRPPRPLETTRGVTRRGGDTRALALVFAAPTWGHEDHAAFAVAGELLTLDGAGLLTRALAGVESARRPSVSTWWEPAPGYGRLVVRFDLTPQSDPETLLPLLQDALADALDAGIDEAAIRGIARLSATQTLLNREQLRMTGIYIAADLVHGGPDGFVGYLDRLEAVTADDVARVLGRWLAGAPCLAVLIEPGETAAPAAARGPAMPGAMPGMAAGAMPGAKPGATMPGVAKPGAMPPAAMPPASAPPAATEPAAPAAPAVPPAPAPERTVLESGAVVVSVTNPDSPLTAIHLTMRARARLDGELAAAGAVDLVHRLLDEGFPGCDGPCLAARLRELGALVKTVDDPGIPMDDYYTNGRFSFIRVECAAEHGPAVLALLAEALRGAAFDEADFVRVRGQRLAELGRQQGSARAVAGALLAQALYGDHPLALPAEGDAASLGKLTFAQARAVHAAAFAPRNLVVACVGPQTHTQWCDDVARLLPGAGRPTPALPPLPVTTAPAATTAALGGQLCAIRLGSVLDVEAGDEAALGLLVAILSDRLAMDLRETRGLSYSAGAAAEIEAGQAVLTAWLNPPTPRRDEGLAALREFVAGFDAATITADEVERTHAARRGRLMMRRLSSLGQAYYLAMAELDGALAATGGAATGGAAAPTVEQLQAAAAKYLTGRPWIEVVVD